MTTNNKNIDIINASKGLFAEILFNDLWKNSETFKLNFIKEFNKLTNNKINKKAKLNMRWINENEDQKRPFDFELTVIDCDEIYKIFVDIKYRTNREFEQEKPNSYLKETMKKTLQNQQKPHFIYVVFYPNFYDLKAKKSNLLKMDFVLNKYMQK